jgi:hypothetical protein
MTLTPILMTILLAAGDAPAPSPAPQPVSTALREIGRVRADAACVSLVKLALPVALIAANNDRVFAAMQRPLANFAHGEGSIAEGNQIENAHESTPKGGALVPASERDGTSMGGSGATNAGDDQDTYTPVRTLAASNIDRMVGIILRNLDDADKTMAESWKEHPEHLDPALTALRQRVQNIIDMQRVLAFRLDDAAGSYLSDSGVAGLTPAHEQARFTEALDASVAAEIAADRTSGSEPVTPTLPGKHVSDVGAEKHADAKDVLAALRQQEFALALEAPRLARSCDTPLPEAIPSATAAPSP